jgi:hypothetical protein
MSVSAPQNIESVMKKPKAEASHQLLRFDKGKPTKILLSSTEVTFPAQVLNQKLTLSNKSKLELAATQ